MVYSLVVRVVDTISMKNDNQKRPNANDYSAFALVGQVGIYIAGGALLGVAAGSFIDGKLHTAPVATLIGLLLGLAVGIYGVFRLVSSLK
jgi:ATP synthase protein I